MRHITLTIITVLTAFIINAQNIITGTVSDYTGPLPFANVSIAGTDAGTVADEKGNFSIETNKEDVLTISYVGYVPKDIIIDTLNHLDISLEMDSLDEVIITYPSTRTIYCGTVGFRINYITDSIEEKIIKAYPNPTSTGYVTLDMPEQYTSLEMAIYSVTGQRLIHQTYNQPKESLTVDLSRFSKGIYIINMMADGEALPAQKIIRS